MRASLWTVALLCLPLGLVALLLVAVINRYDQISYGRHSEWIRRVVPWRASAPAALLPLLALSPFLLTGSRADWSWFHQVLALLAALVLAEIYSVCLHRESYIAAFEPWFIPKSRPVLGRPALRMSDRRLHHLVRTQFLYVVPLLAAAVLVDGSDPLVAWIIVFAFLAKFIAPAWVDYEAYFHWDMHCGVLRMRDGERLTALWRGVCEWVLGTAVGSLPYVYSTEHLRIHHPQNAGPGDVHSPLPYRRTSVVEFTYYACKTIVVLATVIGIANHRRVRGWPRARLVIGVGLTWSVAVVAVTSDRPLGIWIAAAVIFRGANTAMAQYVWHGLHDGTGRAHPMSSTINWAAPQTSTAAGATTAVDAVVLPPSPSTCQIPVDVVPSDEQDLPADVVHPTAALREHVPNPGSDWAFYDNHHLIHHLHPRAHFEDYPHLLDADAARIEAFGSPVITLDRYGSFFSDLMARDIASVAAGFQTSDNLETRRLDLVRRLEPWDASRSAVAVVTESTVGRRIDTALSHVWGTVRR